MNKKNLSCDVLPKKTSTNHFILIMRTVIILLFTCVFITVAETVQQQGKTITGIIVDTNGVPIIGANILEKGSRNGTITDFDGNFSLNVKDNAILQISYIGYLE